MTDMPEGCGGETVFSNVWPPELDKRDRKSQAESLQELRLSGDAERAGIKVGSWEEEMVAICRSKFSIRPRAGRAVLFYSQLANGKVDKMSKHGGCPVLDGEKWAANLWVWNTPRQDFKGAPQREDLAAAGFKEEKGTHQQLKVTFRNLGKDDSMKNAVLYYDEAMFWGKLGHEDPPLHVNTFQGHKWNVRVDDKVVKSWVVGSAEHQEFII